MQNSTTEFPSPQFPPPYSGRSSRLLVVLVALVFALILPFLVERVQYAVTRGQQRAKSDVARVSLAKLTETAEAFRLVSRSIGPSVVHIDTVKMINGGRGFFGDESTYLLPQPAQGQGSGVIVDEAGYILTNFHVIRGASKVEVHLSDGRRITNAQLLGYDPLTDLAVLKISANGLVSAPWGDSNALEVGDWVVAVGNPYGLDRTVTAGIVSGKDRRGVVEDNPYQQFLQTDAAINPGNSGGPLLNLQGQVVGINTAIVGPSFQGIGFAIPSDIARDVFDRLKKDGKVSRGWLGVGLQALTPELARQLQVRDTGGALVTEVLPDSPAEKARLLKDDVIVEWNRQKVTEPTALSLLVAQTKPRTKVKVTVKRLGKNLSLQVEVGERPNIPEQ